MKKTSVLLLFGGRSTEYEVSCVTASNVFENIDRDKFDIILVGITKEGSWYRYRGSSDRIRGLSWQSEIENIVPCALIPPQFEEKSGTLATFGDKTEKIIIDVILPMVHGSCGEDGTIQGLAKICGIPCCGADLISSVCSFDKSVTKALCERYGIVQASYVLATRNAIKNNIESVICEIEEKIGYPAFIKPANSGSSVGISKSKSREALKDALTEAAKYDTRILIEEFIDGREIEIAMLGNEVKILSVCGEIVPHSEFYDYATKYINETAEYFIPAGISESEALQIKEISKKVCSAVYCDGFARIDFFIRRGGEIVFNEINTIPGFTKISMYPKLMNYSGIPYGELIAEIIRYALEREAAN